MMAHPLQLSVRCSITETTLSDVNMIWQYYLAYLNLSSALFPLSAAIGIDTILASYD